MTDTLEFKDKEKEGREKIKEEMRVISQLKYSPPQYTIKN